MRRLNWVYTQRYNRRHKWGGSLFRDRYKSNLIGNESSVGCVIERMRDGGRMLRIRLDKLEASIFKG